jgi:catechol 2,3-dioxygenase-like lactoylglutathione lyase family enzyme
MISGGNATVYVSDLEAAIQFYTERLGLKLTNRIGQQWATVQTGPSYWTTDEVGAGLTLGLHPHSAKYPRPGTPGGVGFGLETYEPADEVAEELTRRGVRVDKEIIRFEAGNVFCMVDHDGLPTYVHEFPPEMLPESELSDTKARDREPVAGMIAGGHAIVYVRNMDAAVRFYTETLGLRLTYRFEDKIAFAEAGRLVIAIHPKTPNTPDPGSKGSVMLGLTLDEPIDRVVARLTNKGVRFTGPIIRAEGNFAEFEDPSGNALYLWEGVTADTPKDDERQAVTSGQ